MRVEEPFEEYRKRGERRLRTSENVLTAILIAALALLGLVCLLIPAY